MREEHRTALKAAIERAKKAAGDRRIAANAPVPETAHQNLQKRFEKHWSAVIRPVLAEHKVEFIASGFDVDVQEPGESCEGRFAINASDSEDHWQPTIWFKASDDGSTISVLSTFGLAREQNPLHESFRLEDLTAEKVGELVLRVVQGMS